jgi:hypothetical protein
MRFHYASLRRAEQAAKSFLGVLQNGGHPTSLTQARSTLAKATGHSSWQELRLSLGRSPEPSAYDERLDLSALRLRLRQQSEVVADAFGMGADKACLIVAAARLTAHPAGPHKLSGLSAAPLSKPNMRSFQIEYRGTHPDQGPLVFMDGTLRPYLQEGTLSAAIGLRDRILVGRREGYDAFWNGIFTRIFLYDPVGEEKVYDDLITALHRMVWDVVMGTILNETYQPGEAVEGPTFEARLAIAA